MDIAVGWLLYRLVLGWAWPGRRAEMLALGAAALYVFNPVTWYDSALWGQTDAAGALVLLLCVAALVRGNAEGAAALAVLAALVKPQFGVVALPLVGIVLLRRHLVPAVVRVLRWFGGFLARRGWAADVSAQLLRLPPSLVLGPRHAPWGPGFLRGWLSREQGFLRLLTSAAVALIVFTVVAAPFEVPSAVAGEPATRMWIPEYLRLMSSTAGGYAYLSVNAYNLWALVATDGHTPLASAWDWSPDTTPFLGPIPGVVVGATLLVLGFLWGIWRAGRAGDRWTIILAAAYLCMAFFVLPTRVHERYLFPAFVFLPLLAVVDRRWLVSLVVIAIGSFINLHGILTMPAYGTPNVDNLLFGELFQPGNFTFVLLAAVLQTGVFLFGAWELRRKRVPDPFELAAGEVAGVANFRAPIPDGARPVGDVGAAGAAAGAATMAGADGWTEGADGAVLVPVAPAGPTASQRLARRIFAPRIRRDRSASLAMEKGGRLTRLDALAMLLLVGAALVLRGFNLAQPYDMYFDEVYHARTGMEFLQHWRYGERHSIYEYTHPHLAKYAMAWSIDTFGENKVTKTGDVGATGVTAAATERRWSPSDAPAEHNGDRLFVATSTGIAVFDLRDDSREATIPGVATALAVRASGDEHALYLAGPDGTISRVDTTLLDAQRSGSAGVAGLEVAPVPVVELPGDATVVQLAIADDTLVALLDDETLVSVDLATGSVTGTGSVAGAVAIAGLPSTTRVIAYPAEVPDRPAAALLLAEALFDDADRIGGLLDSGAAEVVLAGYVDDATNRTIQEGIEDGTLTGIELVGGPVVGVAGREGVSLLDAATLAELDLYDTGGPAMGLGLNATGLGEAVLYVAGADAVRSVKLQSSGPVNRNTIPLPDGAAATAVFWNEPSNLVHVLGRTADGQPTVYVIEPNGDSLFADAVLPFEPVALAMDTQPERPSDDRTQLLAVAADGRTASVEVGSNAFAWRLPGMALGALTVGVLYLLARLLFRRRSVAVFAGLFALAEGMLFANSRIAMNDVYITFFVLCALTLFVGLWVGRWQRAWQVVVGFIGIGLLLGLALASKWVAAYAIGGFALLILFRSALGRVLALTGMIAITAVLGGVAIRPAEVEDPQRNWLFLLIMVGLTLALAAAMVRRPVRFTVGELGVAIVVPAILGGFLLVAGVLFGGTLPAEGTITGARVILGGAALLATSVAIYVVAWLAGRGGIGPLARVRGPISPDAPVPAPPPDGWLRPGGRGLIGWLFAMFCLTAIPVAVYVALYLPWADLGNQIVPGFPAGNTGTTLWDLTRSMYDYHNNLRATHAASSPWWAWPLDLKPVWFYQTSFANDTAGSIYDSGNLVIFWMGIPALLFASWAAWTRRSLALTAIVIMFCAMWLPWSRIDRATFQYHVYTSLPFVVMALAYWMAELWHGPSRFGWTLAKVSAALAIIGAPLLWLFRQPLCSLAGVERMNPNGEACGDVLTRNLPLSEQGFAALLVLAVGAGVFLWVWRLSAGRGAAPAGSLAWARRPELALVAVAGLTIVALLLVTLVLSSAATSQLTIGAEHLALAALLLLGIPALMALRARDPKRFAGGVVLAAIVFLIAWYPNLSGLPLPKNFVNVYQGLLPTWNYAFQFAVNTDPPVKGGMVGGDTLAILGITLILVIVAMIAARFWGPSRSARGAVVGEVVQGP
jgi:dolichyl-phosphate-mannose--protein O-mannosyl transferase